MLLSIDPDQSGCSEHSCDGDLHQSCYWKPPRPLRGAPQPCCCLRPWLDWYNETPAADSPAWAWDAPPSPDVCDASSMGDVFAAFPPCLKMALAVTCFRSFSKKSFFRTLTSSWLTTIIMVVNQLVMFVTLSRAQHLSHLQTSITKWSKLLLALFFLPMSSMTCMYGFVVPWMYSSILVMMNLALLRSSRSNPFPFIHIRVSSDTADVSKALVCSSLTAALLMELMFDKTRKSSHFSFHASKLSLSFSMSNFGALPLAFGLLKKYSHSCFRKWEIEIFTLEFLHQWEGT